MGLLTFGLNVTLDGCYDHREMTADDELHDDFTQLIGGQGECNESRGARAAMVPPPVRARKVGGSNPLARTTPSPR